MGKSLVFLAHGVEKTCYYRPWPWAYYLNGPNAAAPIAPTLIRH